MLSGDEARAAEVAAELDATRLFLLEEQELKVGGSGVLPPLGATLHAPAFQSGKAEAGTKAKLSTFPNMPDLRPSPPPRRRRSC